MPFVLGVDSSAQSTMVELRDADSGEIFGSGRAPHADPETSAEQDPLAWWNALVDARRDAGGATTARVSSTSSSATSTCVTMSSSSAKKSPDDS